MKEITVNADRSHLEEVQHFVEIELEKIACPIKICMQIALAIEEIFVNIADYAYHPNTGTVTIRSTIQKSVPAIMIQFLDQGKPYNPLERIDADITLNAEERAIGGLGILLVKKTMDNVKYEYKDGKNILTIQKNLK
jgi:serine/threonine-protein kinase RsbW